MSSTPPDKREIARAAALARIASSRQQLRRQLIHEDEPVEAGGRRMNIPRRMRALWRVLRRGLHGSPMAGVALGALQQWWQGHPWRATGELLAEEVHASLTPIVRRHPVATMAVSAVIGLGLMTARPWRWPAVRRQVAPLPGRLVRWLFRQLGQAPGQALLSGLLVMMASHKAQAEPAQPDVPPDKT